MPTRPQAAPAAAATATEATAETEPTATASFNLRRARLVAKYTCTSVSGTKASNRMRNGAAPVAP